GAWASVDGEDAALGSGVATASSATLAERWAVMVGDDLARWGRRVDWPDPSDPNVSAHADRGCRSDGFARFQADLTAVVSLDPAATW
ncbi:MAG: hypothetical protein AAGG08_13720, partial [Actinomycetota bacterium]